MNPQRQQQTGCLVPALAFDPLDLVDAADDGLDTLLEFHEVCILWQALQRGVEVEVGVLVRHLGENLGHGTPAKPLGLIGQESRPGGAEMLQGSENTLEE